MKSVSESGEEKKRGAINIREKITVWKPRLDHSEAQPFARTTAFCRKKCKMILEFTSLSGSRVLRLTIFRQLTFFGQLSARDSETEV